MSKHSPEPWHTNGTTSDEPDSFAIYNDDSEFVATLMYPFAEDAEMPSDETREANAERIVACVNACKGINPACVPELVEFVKFVAMQPNTGEQIGRLIDKAYSALALSEVEWRHHA